MTINLKTATSSNCWTIPRRRSSTWDRPRHRTEGRQKAGREKQPWSGKTSP
ncbi:hypothetical protein KIF59_11615 [Enterobacter cloacae subsp. cloacae]|nr:hypothetical protein [Enterobacter cloacae subsp. cloacae]